ncbi:MAG: hypothetical protein ACE5KW_02240 [Dehalococcoidia bacterium]
MFGIVTVLEGEPEEQVRALWSELRAAFGADLVKGLNLPHLSFHVADRYEEELARALLKRVGGTTEEFSVPTPALVFVAGEFTGVGLIAMRTPALSALHDALWGEATRAATGVVMRYERDQWQPGIALCGGDTIVEASPLLVRALGEGRLPARLPINNLALIEETATGHELVFKARLRARSADG